MHLETLSAENFRNLIGSLSCTPGLNIIFGENGQGKTNWLEAIYLLSTARSFKTTRLQETIRFGENQAITRGRVRQSEEIARDLQVILEGNTKTLTINNKKVTAAKFASELHVLVFNSDHLEIVRSSPSARRDFLDQGILSIYPPFARTISDYSKVLKQKNAILSKARDDETPVQLLKPLIEPWNEQLVSLANHIFRARMRFVERLNQALEKNLFGKEEVSIEYASNLEGKGDLNQYESVLIERLDFRLSAEIYAGRSLIGPHRDDLKVQFDGIDLRKFGSSGQQRSALLILLLARLSVFHEQNNEYPLFLLDDLDAELDYRRIGILLEFLEAKTQTFVTTSKESFIERFQKNANVSTIVEGASI